MRLLGVALAVVCIATPIVPTFESAQGVSEAQAQRKRPAKKDKRSRKQKKIDRHMFTAQYYFLKERDLKAAARELNRVIRLDRGHVEASIGLAVILGEQKKTKKAIKVLKKLAKKKPKEVRVWYALAQTHSSSGDLKKALAAYRKAVSLVSSDREALYQIYALTNRLSQTKQQASVADVKTAALAFIRVEHNRQSYRYREVERRLVEVSGEPVALVIYDANRAYQAAFTERRMGRINAKMGEARKGYERCIKMQPKNQRCQYGLGLVYSSVKASGHYDRKKARSAFRSASKLAEAHFELGRLSRLDDNFDDARDSLVRALDIRTNYPHAHLEIGIVYKLEGKDEKALSHFLRAVNADRHSAVAEKALGEIAKIDPEHEYVRAGLRYGLGGDVFSTDRYRAAVSLIEKAYGGVDNDAPEKVVLETVLSRILEAADVDSTQHMTVGVLNTPIVNAMALPNGNIYFTRGFLDFLKKTWPDRKVNANNDVLAHVMAHEIAHVLRNHTLNSVLFQQAYKDSGSRLDGAVVTHVTRLQEIEADRVGIVLASLAGYHPRGGIEFMEHQGQKDEIPTHLDHPTYEERARYLEEYWTNDVKYAYLSFQLGNRSLESGNKILQSNPKKARKHYSAAIDHFSRFRTTLKPTKRVLNNLGVAYSKRGMISFAGQNSPLERWQSRMSIEKNSALKYRSAQRKRKTEASPGTRGSAKRSVPRDLTKAMKLFRDALKRDPHYARASVNLAMVQIAIGKPTKALSSLKEIKVNSGMLNLTRGIALAEKGKYSKAAAAFATATKAKATKRAATFNLARAYQLGKHKEKAKRYYQRYLRKYPKGPWAAAAKKAMKKL